MRLYFELKCCWFFFFPAAVKRLLFPDASPSFCWESLPTPQSHAWPNEPPSLEPCNWDSTDGVRGDISSSRVLSGPAFRCSRGSRGRREGVIVFRRTSSLSPEAASNPIEPKREQSGAPRLSLPLISAPAPPRRVSNAARLQRLTPDSPLHL